MTEEQKAYLRTLEESGYLNGMTGTSSVVAATAPLHRWTNEQADVMLRWSFCGTGRLTITAHDAHKRVGELRPEED